METRTADRSRIREINFMKADTPKGVVSISNGADKPKRIVRQKRVCVPGVWVAA